MIRNDSGAERASDQDDDDGGCLGAVPLVVEHGAGAELHWPLGVTIIGGLLPSQLLTLYTTPMVHLAFERLRMRVVGSGPKAVGAGEGGCICPAVTIESTRIAE